MGTLSCGHGTVNYRLAGWLTGLFMYDRDGYV